MSDTEILLTIKLQQQLFVDPKRIRLLKEIQRCGSINQAAKNANVSYKSAWDHLQAMNEISPKPLLERSTGGKNGGGTTLTNYARRLLQLYDLLEQTQNKAFQILHDENIPLNSLLSATACFSLQSSARNQFFGKVTDLIDKQINCLVEIEIAHFNKPIYALITKKSALKLQLIPGKEVMVMFKAPWVKIQPSKADGQNYFQVKVNSILDKGEFKEISLQLNKNIEFCAILSENEQVKANQTLSIHIDPEQVILATLY
ncbi:MAG TPA: molybdenum-dependent transcriptional regulator [Pasteurellaceae bacterium]|nr:molybdenum-dependent transcriptional regulator [Pasteurellaceae bacterium]